ncbi:hypothetical protein DWG95_02675 [Escherichia coli]|nr:hypothetical protein [Escherichia coli]PSY67759.1 hypothetical protein C7B16_03565 [Escherichia sp. 20412-1]
MRRFARLIRPTVYGQNVGRIRRLRRIRHEQRAQNAAHHCAFTHSITSAHSPRKTTFSAFFSS